MTIMQGDSYTVYIDLKDETGEPVGEYLSDIIVTIGHNSWSGHDGTIGYDSDEQAPFFVLEESQTFNMIGVEFFQIRAIFGDDIYGIPMEPVFVIPSIDRTEVMA